MNLQKVQKVNDENSRIRTYPNPDLDLLVKGMDPRIRIHTKMSWIRNTGFVSYMSASEAYCFFPSKPLNFSYFLLFYIFYFFALS